MPGNGYARLEQEPEDADAELKLKGLQRVPGGEKSISSFWQRFSFWWANDAVEWGAQQWLEEEQLWELSDQDTLESCTEKLMKAWAEETKGMRIEDLKAEKTAKGEGPSIVKMPLARAFFRVHWATYRNWLLVKLLNDFNQTLP